MPAMQPVVREEGKEGSTWKRREEGRGGERGKERKPLSNFYKGNVFSTRFIRTAGRASQRRVPKYDVGAVYLPKARLGQYIRIYIYVVYLTCISTV